MNIPAPSEHPSAEMLYKTLRPKYPSMSFATVYKTVEILNRLHVIQILNTGEDSFRYDADISEHHHVQCTCCGKVEDLFNVAGTSFIFTVSAKTAAKNTERLTQGTLWGPVCFLRRRCLIKFYKNLLFYQP